MLKRIFILLVAFTLSTALGFQINFVASTGVGISVKDVASEMYCPCGCSIILSVCEETMRCEVAGKVKAEIQDMIDKEWSKEQILEAMKERYGLTILANPPKEGFSLTLWIYPIIGLGVGLAVIYAVSKRRRDVEWRFDPDEILELSEEEFAEATGLESGETPEKREISEKYERLFEEEYRRFKARKGKRSSSPA